MSFIADKKREHEGAAEKALMEKDYAKAFFHTAKAAEFGLRLADETEGKIAHRYIQDAMELIDIAGELKDKARSQPRASTHKAVKEPTGEESQDWLITEKPSLRLSDIAGMNDVKTKLAEMVIDPMRHAEKARQWGIRPGGGILLFGPPGNGKTTLGKALAGELDAAFFYSTGAQIRSKWHGESEQRLRKLVQTARSQAVSVLFLDDVDGLLPRRGGGSVVDNRIVVQFLAEIGGFENSQNILLVLGATNKPWAIDEGVFRTGRFDEKIFVGLPEDRAREFLIRRNLGTVNVANDVDVLVLVAKLTGYTGSDIVAIIQSAKRAGFRRSISGGSDLLTADDIHLAMKTIPCSVTPKLMRQYEDFAKNRFT